MAEIEIREVTHDEYHAWDRLATDSPQGTVFHSSDWIATCASLSHKRPLLLGYFEDDRLAGGCSLYVTEKARLFSSCDSTAPMTPYGGYLLQESAGTKVREKEAENRSMILAISSEIAGRNFFHAKIISSPPFQDLRPLTGDGWTSRVYYSYLLRLGEDLSSNISKKARNTIRKGEKSEIRIRKYNDPEMFWDLTVHTYEKQNRAPPYSKAFLMGMIDLIIKKNIGEMWIAETPSGEPASAEVIIWDSRMAHRWAGASSSAHRMTGATSMLLFTIFQDLWERGFKEINLMGANMPHLSRFVSSFNPELIPYYGVEKARFLFDAAMLSRKHWGR